MLEKKWKKHEKHSSWKLPVMKAKNKQMTVQVIRMITLSSFSLNSVLASLMWPSLTIGAYRHVTFLQICYAMSRPGRIYHVDCECCNGGIPYADSFFVVLRYCLTRVCPTKCRVIVTGDLRYKKHVMMMFKSKCRLPFCCQHSG